MRRRLSILSLTAALLCSGTIFVAVADAPATPQILQTPDLPPSDAVKSETALIYDPSQTIGIGVINVSPWADANALITRIRNKMLSIEINALNNGLYLQGYGAGNTPYDEVFTAHFWTYCANSAPNDQVPGGSCQGDPLMQDADINVASILSGFRYDEGGARETAAKMFLNNLINPFPAPDYLDSNNNLTKESLSDPKQRQRIADALTQQAILSVPRSALADMIAKRAPVSTSKGSVSMMQVMEKEAAQRFLNSAWQANMQDLKSQALKNSKPEQAVLYELAMMDAYRNWMLYENYRQMERLESLLSALIALNYKQAVAGNSFAASASAAAGGSVSP